MSITNNSNDGDRDDKGDDDGMVEVVVCDVYGITVITTKIMSGFSGDSCCGDNEVTKIPTATVVVLVPTLFSPAFRPFALDRQHRTVLGYTPDKIRCPDSGSDHGLSRSALHLQTPGPELETDPQGAFGQAATLERTNCPAKHPVSAESCYSLPAP